jgi:hypothetical protein
MTILDYEEILDHDGEPTALFEVRTKDWRGREKVYTGSILGFYDLETGHYWRGGADQFKKYMYLEQLRKKITELKTPKIRAID